VQQGPAGCRWEFVTERMMGHIARNVRSRRFPFVQLANFILAHEQVNVVANHLKLGKELNFRPPCYDPEEISNMEQIYSDISKHH